MVALPTISVFGLMCSRCRVGNKGDEEGVTEESVVVGERRGGRSVDWKSI